MYGFPTFLSQERGRLLPEQLQLTGLYNTDTFFFLQFQTSAFKQFIRYLVGLLHFLYSQS
jgi:hypothetical protein